MLVYNLGRAFYFIGGVTKFMYSVEFLVLKNRTSIIITIMGVRFLKNRGKHIFF